MCEQPLGSAEADVAEAANVEELARWEQAKQASRVPEMDVGFALQSSPETIAELGDHALRNGFLRDMHRSLVPWRAVGGSNHEATQASPTPSAVLPPPELYWALTNQRRIALTGGVGGWGMAPSPTVASRGMQAVRCGGDGYAACVAAPLLLAECHVITFTLDRATAEAGNMLIGVVEAEHLSSLMPHGGPPGGPTPPAPPASLLPPLAPHGAPAAPSASAAASGSGSASASSSAAVAWGYHPFYGAVLSSPDPRVPGEPSSAQLPSLRGAATGATVSSPRGSNRTRAARARRSAQSTADAAAHPLAPALPPARR